MRVRALAGLAFLIGIGCFASAFAADAVATKSDAPAAAPDQRQAAAALEKIYATVTLDPEHNITAVDFTDSDFSDTQIALLRGLPKLETVVIVGSIFTDKSVPLVSGLPNVKQLTLENTEMSNAGLVAIERFAGAANAQRPPHFEADRRRFGFAQRSISQAGTIAALVQQLHRCRDSAHCSAYGIAGARYARLHENQRRRRQTTAAAGEFGTAQVSQPGNYRCGDGIDPPFSQAERAMAGRYSRDRRRDESDGRSAEFG